MSFDDMAWSSIPSGSPIGVHQFLFDPCLDFAPSVADMSAYSESGGSFFPVSPLVEGGDGDREIVGELFTVRSRSRCFIPSIMGGTLSARCH